VVTERKFIQCEIDSSYQSLFLSKVATFQCNTLKWEEKESPSGRCTLQAWDETTFGEMVISCGLERCTQLGLRSGETAQKIPADKYVGIGCSDIKCSCSKAGGCGAATTAFASLTQGGSVHCNNDTNECILEQPDLSLQMSLHNCGGGECVSELATIPNFPQPSITPIIYGSIGGFLVLCLIVCCAISLLLGTVFDIVHTKRMKTEWKLLTERSHGLNISVQRVSLTKRWGKGKILDDVSCEIETGNLVAIMGASGAGKTSLLDVIAGRNKSASLSGRILYDGISIKKLSQRHVGYVFQDELMFESLTVRETLNFIADLRIPSCVSGKQKRDHVQLVLESLKIAHIAKSRVSRISGGEKRRLSLGVELIALPPCLALDEITSGLDSQTAQLCCNLLQKLCKEKGRTIVCSIHQPRSNIWRMFDKVILLSKGRLIYSGPRTEAVSFLESKGFAMPAETNPADFIIDCLVGMEEREAIQGDCVPQSQIEMYEQQGTSTGPSQNGKVANSDSIEDHVADTQDMDDNVERINATSDQAFDQEYNTEAQVEEFTLNTTDPTVSPIAKNGSIVPPIDDDDDQNDRTEIADSTGKKSSLQLASTSSVEPYFFKSKYAVSYLRQVIVLSRRAFKNFRRNFVLLPLQYGSAIFIGIVVGLMFWKLGFDIAGSQSRSGVLFFSLFILAFGSMSNLDIFIRERRIFTREVASGWYNPLCYFTAKALFDIIPLRIAPPILMGSIFYWMCELNSGAGNFFWFLFILVLFNICSGAMGIMIGIASPSVGIANFTSILMILGNSLFAGFLINRRSLPNFISWASWLSYWSYAFEALLANEFIGQTLTLSPQAVDLSITVGGSFWLSEFGMNQDNFYIDIVAVGCYAALFLIVSGVLLTFVRERR